MDADLTGRLLVAMSNVWPADPIQTLKDAGFDAHCRRPCSTWRIVDLVEAFFAAPATPEEVHDEQGHLPRRAGRDAGEGIACERFALAAIEAARRRRRRVRPGGRRFPARATPVFHYLAR